MTEQPIGPILDGLGVSLEVDDGDLIASAVVILKVLDKDGDAALALATSEGLSWIDQNGLLASAQQIVNQGAVLTKGDDE
ncbi:hypothetical protein ACFQ0X_43630 [Streptomyces rectiviolaceus]|uniref:Uncharacterized protein n=1 Tax=Streptomyces rectiviolaceus TaxID=332591 RepID=A0ABP6NN16_9ACTN